MTEDTRLIVVSNRLPVRVELDEDRHLRVEPGAGGLVTAMAPVLRARGGTWLGWSGLSPDDALPDQLRAAGKSLGYEIEPLDLTEDEVAGFYEGFANEVLWPLFHDLIGHCNFDSAYWPVYEAVNRKFAQRAAQLAGPDDYIWVHDYQLIMVGKELADLGVHSRVGFFLHIPFPPMDVFIKMQWREQLLEGLLAFDLVGFQTERDLRNFVQCLEYRSEEAEVEADAEHATIHFRGRTVRAGVFPISIDYADFLRRSVEDPVSELVARVRMKLPSRSLVLGLDRLDYTKGIPNRLEAFDYALHRHPELRGRVTLLLIVVPSRTGVGDYQQLKDEIDRLVGRINGDHAAAGWTPIQYIFRRLTQHELLAYYRACDIALITPLKDGMNLVCKEYCACSLEDDGVLILSEFAGAASELAEGALLVNPFDEHAVGDALHRALTMPDAERRHRMQLMRQQVRDNNVHAWVERYLAVALSDRRDRPRLGAAS